jgi:hypothetical protein
MRRIARISIQRPRSFPKYKRISYDTVSWLPFLSIYFKIRLKLVNRLNIVHMNLWKVENKDKPKNDGKTAFIFEDIQACGTVSFATKV